MINQANITKIILASVLIFSLSGQARAEKEFRVVVFGDSLTSGYQIQNEEAFPAKLESKIRSVGYNVVKVISISDPGATTAAAIQDVDLVKEQLPDVIVVMLGINDVIRRVPPSATLNNLNTIIARLKQTNAYVVLVGVAAPAQAGQMYQQEVQNNFTHLAKRHRVAFFPTALAGVEGNPHYTMADGIHPNALGVEVMVENIFPYVDTGLRWKLDVYRYELELKRLQTPGAMLPPV